MYSTQLLTLNDRLIPVLDALPGVDARLLVQEVRPAVLSMAGQLVFMIISDPCIAKDLFVTNGAVFSSISGV